MEVNCYEHADQITHTHTHTPAPYKEARSAYILAVVSSHISLPVILPAFILCLFLNTSSENFILQPHPIFDRQGLHASMSCFSWDTTHKNTFFMSPDLVLKCFPHVNDSVFCTCNHLTPSSNLPDPKNGKPVVEDIEQSSQQSTCTEEGDGMELAGTPLQTSQLQFTPYGFKLVTFLVKDQCSLVKQQSLQSKSQQNS